MYYHLVGKHGLLFKHQVQTLKNALFVGSELAQNALCSLIIFPLGLFLLIVAEQLTSTTTFPHSFYTAHYLY